MKIIERTLPWFLFLVLLTWGWRVRDWFNAIPTYGDVLEVLWGIAWYGEHFFTGEFFFARVFHPAGWDIFLFGYGPGLFIQLIPLYKFGGAAFAFNAATLLSFFIAFAGMYNLARRGTRSHWIATLAGLAYTFWGFRWIRIHGHLNVLIATALLPWMVWCIERGTSSSRRAWGWFALTGILWAVASANHLYFVWIGGFLLVGWIGGCVLNRRIQARVALASISVASVAMVVASAPFVFVFARANISAGASLYNIDELTFYSASLNSIFIPALYHPLLADFARQLYTAPLDESAVANFGIVTGALALRGLARVTQDKTHVPAVVLMCVGIIFAFGLFAKWDRALVQVDWLAPINKIIWRFAHQLKPDFFASAPPAPFERAVPLPGLLLVALVPFIEGARVFSRYAFVASIGLFLLAAQEIRRMSKPIPRVALALVLIFEIIPPPSGNFAYPPPTHPAFEWLRENTLPDEAIIDLSAAGDRARLLIRAETLAATDYHQRATVAGSSSVLPAHTKFLNDWLLAHPNPFADREFIPMLRSYRADWIVLHILGVDERALRDHAQLNSQVQFAQCFDPPRASSPLNYPICIFKILPSP